MTFRWILTLFLLIAIIPASTSAQKSDPSPFQNLRWRMIGPHRGGRTVGVAGIPDRPNIFYIGVNNGGVWRTSDYGRTWIPIFDDQPTGSIGALAVAPSNPDVIYVGSGEGLHRPDLSVGDGIFKSTDAGATWNYCGLADAQQIGAVIVDPRDANKVYVAVLGHPYGANEQRGVFRSTDGGKSWQKILYKDENTGAIALTLDPVNPDVIYADLWSDRHGPWENGSWSGKTSGLFKSTDGGTTWKQLTAGLPSGEQGLGRIGITIFPGDPSRIYAIVDARDLSGVYRSDDAGEHWTRINKEDRVFGRGSDFAEIDVDPKNRNIVYVANTCSYRSTDGGKTFTAFKGAPGGDDYHTIWINPLHPEIILIASDQGATITVNGGQSWSSWYNQPTAQFYHVITDNEFPYNVYGGQQESGSVGIASRGNDGHITFREWHPVAADEYAYIAPDPLHPNIIYGGKASRFDKLTGQVQNVAPEALRSGQYRFLRTSPLMFSPVNSHALYLASNVLFRTTTGGDSWDVISPDLSREKPDVPANIGIFTTPELASQPRRGVIYALALSPVDEKIIWAGTDDGLVHVSRDGGASWKNVTFPALTSWSKVAGMDAGHFDPMTAYIAVNRIKLDDMRPHIYRTHDGGTTWEEIVKGLPESGPVNIVREDPTRKGLLFAGTERAVYVSLNDGDSWLPLRLNMPATSIRDLVIHNSDIVVGTHGRSFWILDNISSIRQLAPDGKLAGTTLFSPDSSYLVRWNMNTDTPLPPEEPAGENPPDGATIDYYLANNAKHVSLEISDAKGGVVRTYTSDDLPEPIDTNSLSIPTYWIRPQQKLSAQTGMHRFVWDLRYTPPDSLPRSFPISAVLHNTASQPKGPWVYPGTYTVTLDADGKKTSQHLTVKMDPRVSAGESVLQAQFELSMACYNGLERLRKATGQVKLLRRQIDGARNDLRDSALVDTLTSLNKLMNALLGDGVPADVDVMYFKADDLKKDRETFALLQTRMLYLMTLLQNAEAKPTVSQVNSVKEQQRKLETMMTWWRAFTTEGLASTSKLLKKAGKEGLKAE